MGLFIESRYLSLEQAAMVRQAVRDLLVTLRPDAVALVDAFNLSDHSLNSCLGRYGNSFPQYGKKILMKYAFTKYLRWLCIRGFI